jgi:hypothetical protein
MGYDSSVAALFLISIERLFAISFPLKHLHKVTRGSCRVAIAISWTVAIIKNAIPFFWNNWRPHRPCTAINTFTDAYGMYVYNVYLYGLMGCIVLVNFALCIMVIRASSKGPMSTKTTTSELKIVKIVLMVSTVLFVTYIPTNILGNLIIERLVRGKPVAFHLLVTFHMCRGVTLLSIVADPVIYFSNNPQCQKAVAALFRCSEAVQKQRVYTLSASKQKAEPSTSETPDTALNGTKL